MCRVFLSSSGHNSVSKPIKLSELASPPPLFVALDGAVSFTISATADTLGRESGTGLMTDQDTVLFLQELIQDIIITGRVPYTPLSPLSA